jgi:hypothetical protein
VNYNFEDDVEIDYFDEEDYELDRQKESAKLNRLSILSYENRYGCTFPEFILMAITEKECIDLATWGFAIRSLAANNESIYAPI